MSRIPGRQAGIALMLALTACSSAPMKTGGENPAWFGLPPPIALANPQIVPAGEIPASVLPSGEVPRNIFTGGRIRQTAGQVIDFAREMRQQGNQMWGRISGFPSEDKTATWLAGELSAAGAVEVVNQTYQGTGEFWWPKSWEVRVLSDPDYGDLSIDVELSSAVPVSRSFITGTIEAPAVFVGDAGEVTTDGVAGKIAIQHTLPTTGAYSDRTKVRESSQKLIQAGAAAVITWVEQAGNMHVFDFGQCGGPCFNIGGGDGRFLTGAIKAAKDKGAPDVKLRLALDAEMRSGLSAKNVIGIVPGASEEVIIVNAHLDSWFDGAGDNADGVAVLVALARYFARGEEKPARTLVFVGSGGHHSSGMNGPANVVSMNAELTKRAVLVVNLEHLAQFQIDAVPAWKVNTGEEPKNFGVSNSSPFLVSLVKEAAQRYGFVIRPEVGNSVPGDLGGYAPLGVARIQGIHSGPLYHTSGDVLDSLSGPGLEKAARFYAYVIEKAAKASKEQINP